MARKLTSSFQLRQEPGRSCLILTILCSADKPALFCFASATSSASMLYFIQPVYKEAYAPLCFLPAILRPGRCPGSALSFRTEIYTQSHSEDRGMGVLRRSGCAGSAHPFRGYRRV